MGRPYAHPGGGADMSDLAGPSGSRAPSSGPAGGGGLPRSGGSGVRRGDRVFLGLSVGAGVALLGVIVAIAVFLINKALPALAANNGHFLSSSDWDPNNAEPHFGI